MRYAWTTLWLLFTAQFAAIGGEATTNLYDSLARSDLDQEASMSALRAMPPNQLLTFCDDFGKAVDAGRESWEGAVILVMAMNIYKSKTNMTFGTLMNEVESGEKSLCWRRIACRFSSGKDGVLDRHQVPTAEAAERWAALLAAQSTPSELKRELYAAAEKLFLNSTPEERKALLPLLKDHESLARRPQVRKIRQEMESKPSPAVDHPKAPPEQ